MPALLKLVNVSKVYRPDSHPVYAVKKANLEIKKGEFVAIMGPSGSGKSTLMHLAGCLDTPSSGKVLLEGKNISKLSEEELAKIRSQKIGFVFQTFNLIPRTTALDNIALPLIYTGTNLRERKQMAEKALKQVNLKDRGDHSPNQLSGGEQQRVAIARALINDPLIILADEPTGNLDTKSGQEIMEIFKHLNKQGKTVVIVTHESQIANYAKRTIKIIDGEIV
ncbi:macrolide ABC transporter ATP-binding protein [Microgenomates group bacterium RBG_19FT_COMBO_39_10]|nr:MAG: macrolide ABC transporter ATP-binding protein [Microgenomates group bacterium RBG_19FT_COMBO_39_10]